MVQRQLDMECFLMRGAFFTEYMIRGEAAKDAQGVCLEQPLVVPAWHAAGVLFYNRAKAAPQDFLGLQQSPIEVHGCRHSFKGRRQQGILVTPTMLGLTVAKEQKPAQVKLTCQHSECPLIHQTCP